MLRRSATTIAAASLALTTLSGSAASQQTFAQRTQTIRAGIVILDGAGTATVPAASAAPHMWFNLDRSNAIKPAGWVLENPHAKTSMTAGDRARWIAINGALGLPATTVPGERSRITKRNALYWEVDLSALSDSQIADYDILVVCPRLLNSGIQINLTPAERERLRRFVDKGGVLWLDPSALPSANNLDNANSFPVPFSLTAGAVSEFRDLSQPILTSPQPLSLRELGMLSYSPGTSSFDRDVIAPTPLDASIAGILGESFSDFLRFKPVIGAANNRFSLGVARVGDGFVVVTSRAASLKLNRVRTVDGAGNPIYRYDTNLAYTAESPQLETDGIAAGKLAINIISLGREASQPQSGSQKNGSSAIDVGAPLLRRTVEPDAAGSNTAPVLYKGLTVATLGNVIRVYDADPARDLDGDGDSDDGFPDGGVEGRDLVWQIDTGVELSSPVCTEVPASRLVRGDGTQITDMVLAMGSDGRLYGFDLFRYVNGRLATTSALLPGYPISSPGTASPEQVFAPTVHENLAYIADRLPGTQGRFWVVDLISGQKISTGRDWLLGDTAGSLPGFSASPTIGFIPILDNSGGVDRVAYIPNDRNTLTNQPTGFVSLWLGAKGEKPRTFSPSGTDTATELEVSTRASEAGLPIFLDSSGLPNPYGVRLTLIRDDGTVLSENDMRARFSGSVTQTAGVLRFGFNGTQSMAGISGVRVDYTIDYGGDAASLQNAKRGEILLPDRPTGPQRTIVGSLALSPKGVIYAAAAGANGRSAVFGFREEGRGGFRCVMRYELYGAHRMFGQAIPEQQIPAAFSDVDGVTQLIPNAFVRNLLQQPFTTFQVVSAPIVRDDKVFVVARAAKAGVVPTTVLLALRAEPDAPSFYVGEFPAGSQIVQPDLARSTAAQRPEALSTFALGQTPGMSYDPETKLLKFENLSLAVRGQLQGVLSMSQPILIRRPGGGSDTFLYPNSVSGNRMDPLLWYTVLNGFSAGNSEGGLSAATVTGDTIYLGGSSPLRSFIGASDPGSFAFEAMMVAFDTNVSPNDEFLVPSNGRPWLRQLITLRGTDSNNDGVIDSNLRGSPSQTWPQNQGILDWEDYIVRVNQTVLQGSTAVRSVTAGEGVLAALGDQGLYTFSRSDFVVADQGRVAAFDPSGNPTFLLTASGSAGENDLGSSGNSRSIVSPSRAYPLSNNEVLVADPGANRIFRVNRAGVETRAISRFRLDPNVVTANYPSNGPLTLNGPRDVLTYTTIKSAAEIDGLLSPSGAAYEYWTHYLIADTNNHRLVEVVDRFVYDVATRRIGDVVQIGGQSQYGVLLWHSPPAVAGQKLEYNSLSRVKVGANYVYFAGISGMLPAGADLGVFAPNSGSQRGTAGFGGVAIFDPTLPNGVQVFSRVQIPAIGANVFWNDATNSFSSLARPTELHQLKNVNSVTARPLNIGGSTQVLVMVTDGTGIYEITYGPTAGSEYVPVVDWMLPNEAYRAMRRDGANVPASTNPRDLRATYARRLESGEVLVVNGYFGQTRGNRQPDGTWLNRVPFRGEVVQLTGTRDPARFTTLNMGYGVRSITFSLDLVANTRGIVMPVFADRR